MSRLNLAPLALALAFAPACDPADAGGSGGQEDGLVPQEGEVQTGDSCETVTERLSCTPESSRFCDDMAGDLEWGPCIPDAEIECVPEGDEPGCGVCILFGGVPGWDNSGDCGGGDTPLVLRFDDAPLVFSTMSTASFDIGGVGECLAHDWPSPNTPWLALDRNGNGSIDDGTELFGSGTVLESGKRADNGFTALAELDDNHDGRVDEQDAGFAQLVTWADRDDDRRGSNSEILSSREAGLVSIELSYSRNAICDAHGNCGIERAAFTWMDRDGSERRGEVVDVHLPCR